MMQVGLPKVCLTVPARFLFRGAYPLAEFASEVRAFLIGWSVIQLFFVARVQTT